VERLRLQATCMRLTEQRVTNDLIGVENDSAISKQSNCISENINIHAFCRLTNKRHAVVAFSLQYARNRH